MRPMDSQGVNGRMFGGPHIGKWIGSFKKILASSGFCLVLYFNEREGVVHKLFSGPESGVHCQQILRTTGKVERTVPRNK